MWDDAHAQFQLEGAGILLLLLPPSSSSLPEHIQFMRAAQLQVERILGNGDDFCKQLWSASIKSYFASIFGFDTHHA